MELIILEQWRNITGYEGLYQVSNYGRVKRKYNNGKTKILKPISTNNGYLRVSLSKNNVKNMCFVHRLVAQAFLDNPDNKLQVNHISGIKTDNRVENLEWCTAQENIQHAFNTGLNQIDTVLLGKSSSKPVRCITTNTVYNSTMDAERLLGINHSNITACCKGRQKSAGKLSDGTKLTCEYI